ncbi:TPA: phasin family protein, partial [Acinetobacter baumannii]|nr:phasin family protein [Acinetobacter baumannii]
MDNANIETQAEEQGEKNKSKSKSSRKSALDFRKYTKQIWLAGLGAFSRAEEEGNKLFDSLVKVGEELESKTGDLA